MAKSKRRFCWIDLEMTGLDPEIDRILEAAVIITDKELNPVFEWETPVFQDSATLDRMNDWCKRHHSESGLIDRVPGGITEADLDARLMEIATTHFKKTNPMVICGNSIAQDRKFIDRYLPRFAERLHYRMLDVSSFKIVFREMLGREFKKNNVHRALDDIKESIAELRYYLTAIDPTGLAPIDHTPKSERDASGDEEDTAHEDDSDVSPERRAEGQAEEAPASRPG